MNGNFTEIIPHIAVVIAYVVVLFSIAIFIFTKKMKSDNAIIQIWKLLRNGAMKIPKSCRVVVLNIESNQKMAFYVLIYARQSIPTII